MLTLKIQLLFMFYDIGCHNLSFKSAQKFRYMYNHEYIMILKIRDIKIPTLRKNGMLDTVSANPTMSSIVKKLTIFNIIWVPVFYIFAFETYSLAFNVN